MAKTRPTRPPVRVRSVEQLAGAVGRSPATVRRWMKREDWPSDFSRVLNGESAGFKGLPVKAVQTWASQTLAGWGKTFDTARGRAWQGGGVYHDAARVDTTTADWRQLLASADQAILDDLDTMLARSRLEIANNGYAASAQGAFRRLVVGGGITARSAAIHPESGEELEKFNRDLDRLWESWAWEPTVVDVEQTKSLVEKQQLWMNELFAAGGLFILESYQPRADRLNYRLQEVEYEQRDSILTECHGRCVREGVETGDYGEPLAYHLYTASHPLEQWGTRSERVEASRCIHLFRQDRIRQRIGTPWMRSVMLRLRNLAMYDNYTMVQARSRAAMPMFVKQTVPGAGNDVPAIVARQMGAPSRAGNEQTTDGELKVLLQAGVIPVLRYGQDIVAPSPATPDGMYPPFVLEQLKGISAGTGLDLATVCRWYADGNFSSQRQAKLEVQAEVDWVQDVLLTRKVLVRVRRRLIDLAVAERRLSAPGYGVSDLWTEAYRLTNWQGPPQSSIDEIKDQAAWDLRYKSLRAGPEDYFNQQGTTAKAVIAQWAKFLKLARDNGCGPIIERFFGSGQSPNQPKAGMAPDDPARRADPTREPDDPPDLARRMADEALAEALRGDPS